MRLMQIVLGLSLLATPAYAQTPPANPGVFTVAGLDVHMAGGLAHDVHSGFQKPVLLVCETALGLHYGPLYLGGGGSCQGTDGHVGIAVPLVTYVAQGYFHGFLRGAVIQVGYRPDGLFVGKPAYYFMIGASR